MVEKVEVQTPETAPEQPSEDKTFENESRPEWLPEKFKVLKTWQKPMVN